MRHLLLLIAVLILGAAPAAAAEDMPPPMPKPLADQKAQGAQVFYLGKHDVLDGWALIRAGQPEFYYATPGGKAIVMGLLFDGNGNLLTSEQLASIPLTEEGGVVDMMASQLKPVLPGGASMDPVPAPATDSSAAQPRSSGAPEAAASVSSAPAADTPGNRLYLQAQSAPSALYGKADAPVFYAFLDPNCPYCKRFLTEAESYVGAGTIAVRMIPVGFTDISKKQAAFLLASGDGPARMIAYAKGDASQLPAREGLDTQAVESNLALMETWGLNATPIILYRSGRDQQVKIIKGRPKDLAAVVADLTGR